jgi:hypothetical protein
VLRQIDLTERLARHNPCRQRRATTSTTRASTPTSPAFARAFTIT